ncbi:maleate cis-trans isomerase [archaeon]|nr:MAG: maleate cis-trans isomerase [archaeon]
MMLRLGLVIPSSNTTMEYEFWRLASGWATVHAARMRLRRVTPSELEAMERQVLEAASRLADADVDVIGYGCTTGSLFRGVGHDREIVSKIEEETSIKAVATAGAVVDALRALNVNRVCVATPYIEELNKLEKEFLEGNGIKVVEIAGLGVVENTEIGRLPPTTSYELARKVYRPEADGIFISCTNFRTIEIIEGLERAVKKPVVSSNTATFWAMVKKAGVKRGIAGCGRLLQLL